MKIHFLTLLILLLLTHFVHAQNAVSIENAHPIQNPNYDSELAKKLEADRFGMKKYFFVILKTGSNDTTDADFINKSFRGHLDNITQLVQDGKIIIAGPFFKNDSDFRGLYIFNSVSDREELDTLLASDPAIRAKLLEPDVFEWYGSAALPEYLPASDKIWQSKP